MVSNELGGVLTGAQIASEIASGRIVIDPYDSAQVAGGDWAHPMINAASYDLTLGDEVAVYKNCSRVIGRVDSSVQEFADGQGVFPALGVLDAKKNNRVHKFKMTARGWLLRPGLGYLMHTHERVLTRHYIPVLDGKSSVGRLFITVHVTAGYGDPGFDGQYTLEVTAVHPVIVYPGMRFCQMRFHTPYGHVTQYGEHSGHYTGEASRGPVPSMTWKQFQECKK